jgi:hypothetical protein
MNSLMKSIGKHIPLIGIFLLTVVVGAAAGVYFDVPGRIQSAARARAIKATAGQYSCPMHPEVVSAQPGKCPKCGMALTPASEPQSVHAGRGATRQAGQPHGCCAKPQAAKSTLPPGHPPIPAPTTHSDCMTTTDAVPSK